MSVGASGIPLMLMSGQVDLGRQRLITPDGAVSLTTRETELLAYLAGRTGQAVAREDLLVDVWQYRASNPTRAVDLAVKRLRAKIEPDPSTPIHILSVHGVGYRFVPIANPEATPLPPSSKTVPVAKRRTNLTPDRTSFVGRTKELERLHALHKGGHRFITVLGTAGTGKTRLARRHAAVMEEECPSGSWFVDLVEARSLPDVLAAVVEQVGLPAPADADVESVGAALAERLGAGAVLVLDNFEQVVRVAPDISRWIDRIPNLSVLVTSRERLHVRGEMILELAPLQVADAVDLLVARAAAVRRHDRAASETPFSPEERVVLVEVVTQLDGIPLAIELAASRLGTLSPAQLASRLDRRFRLLGDRGSDRPARHATLQAAFDWSWELLEPDEQRALATLSVFDGGFTLEAAEEVLEDDDDPDGAWPADLVQSLRDKSFVVLDDSLETDVRCRLLESVRAYAGGKLDHLDRGDAVRRVHAAYFLREGEALVAGLHTGTGAERLVDLARDRANLLGVADRAPDPLDRVRAALVLAPLLMARGPHQVLSHVLDSAIQDARALPNGGPVLGRLLVARGALALETGSFGQAERDAQEAMRCAPLHLDVRARALASLGSLWNQVGRHAEALTTIREAVELSTRLGDRQLEGRIRQSLARVLEQQDCLEEADAEYERSLRISRRAGDRWSEAKLLSSYATFVLTKRHDAEQAEAMVKEAERLLQRAGDARRIARLLVHFAVGLARLGRPGDAIPVLDRALQMSRQTGDATREAQVRFTRSWCHLDLGAVDEAESDVVKGAKVARKAQHRGHEAVADRLKGLIRIVQGRFIEARALLDDSSEVLQEAGYPGESAVALHGLALLCLLEGDEEASVIAMDRALALRAPPWLQHQVEGMRALVDAQRGDFPSAHERLEALVTRIDSRDMREADLLEPWTLTVGVLEGKIDLTERIASCLAVPIIAMEGLMARRYLAAVIENLGVD